MMIQARAETQLTGTSKLALATSCYAFVLWLFSQAAFAQSLETLRSPLIPGVVSSPPFMPPPPGAPPAIGDGPTPAPVTAGHLGRPLRPPSDVWLPALGPMDKDMVNALVGPALEPPPSTPGPNPGILNGPPAGLTPPVAVVNILPGGGIFGVAPIERWDGQTTRDLGVPRTSGSQTTDFGTDIDQLPAVKARGIERSASQDGPRQGTFPGQFGAKTNRQPNRANAHTTTDLYGNRQLFKKESDKEGYRRARITIAPY